MKENISHHGNEGKVQVTFTATLPMQVEISRAGQAGEIDEIVYVVYNDETPMKKLTEGVLEVTNKTANLNLELIKGETYNVAFWAAANSVYTFDKDAATVEADYSNVLSNDETLDAFYAVVPGMTISGPVTQQVKLTRPFAQINLGAPEQEFDNAELLGVEVKKSQVKFTGVANQLDLFSGEVSGSEDVTFKMNTLPTEVLTVNGVPYKYVAFNYVFAGETGVADLTYTLAGDSKELASNTVPAVNFKRNYRTNILGRLITGTAGFDITIEPGDLPDYSNVVVWDGKTLTEPEEENGVLKIDAASDIAWLSAAVGNRLPSTLSTRATYSLNGKSLELVADLDFGGYELIPVASATGITFDGKGHSIKNIAYGLGVNYSTMFEIVSGTFKNINLENVKAVNENNNRVSALLGYYCGGTVENVHVKNVEIKGSQKLAGLISLITEGSATIKDCSVENLKVSPSAIDQDGGFIQSAGLVGYITTNKATITFENCEVKGNIILNGETNIYPTDEGMWGYYSGSFVGSMGSSALTAADASTINFNNCKTVAVQATPALMVSPRAGEFWGDCTTAGFSYLTKAPMVINVDGEQYVYKTASQKALEAAIAEGGEVELTEDVTLTTTLNIDNDVVLDLAGHTITGPAEARDADGNRIHVIVNNGNLTIENGTVKSNAENGGSAVYNNANATLTITNVSLDGAPIVDGSWPSYAVNNYGNLTINTATINSYHGAIATGGDGVAVINDATVDVGQSTQTKQTSWALYVFENGELTVNNGTFKNTKNENNRVYGGGYICATSSKETIINGGTFDKTEGDNNGSGIYYKCSNLIIKGGTFDTDDVTEHLAEGYAVVEKDGKYVVVADEVELVASETELQNALAAGSSILLYEDINVTKLDLTALTNDVVIDANGKTITTASNYGVQVKAGKNITLKNAKVEMTVEGNYITYAAGFKVENGDYQGNTITLKDCEIRMCNTDWAYAVNVPASVKNLNLVIDGCTLEGAIALQCWGDNNTINITNSNLICNYTTNAMYTSYCVALQGDGTNNSENNTLNISGCAFSYSGVDNYNSTIKAVGKHDYNGANTITVDNCTYGEKVEAY
ncbi:MAG: hypothetical protein IJB08_06240 [Alistipes sp.]|nr:hypothetical protein [Alistipes sp.]